MSLFEDKKIRGCYPGNYGGNIWQTFNIDLERYPGRIALSGKFRLLKTGLGVVSKFIRTNATTTDQWFGIVTDTDILRNGSTTPYNANWVTDDTTGTFNDPKDMEIHETANDEQRLICTRASEIAILNSSSGANVWDADWGSTVLGLTLTSQTYHPIARLQRLIAIGDKVSGVPVIHTIDKTNTVGNSALTFDIVYTVKNIYTSSNRFWIGLMHDYGGSCKIIEWDGTSDTYNNEYELTGAIPMCGWVVNDIPYFLTERGEIYRYNGGGFTKIQDFGFYKENRVVFQASDIGNYGACVDGELVYLNIAMPTLQSFTATAMSIGARRVRAGVWIFNTSNRNLYHYAGLGEHASSGTDINYGCSPLAGVGAIIKTTDRNLLVASASVYTGGATWLTGTTNGIYLGNIPNDSQGNNEGRNRGYFITPYLPFKDAEAMYEGIVAKFKKFANSNNVLRIKWRVNEPLYNTSAADQGGSKFENAINAPITWVNTTSFTCKVPTGVSVGDEVEVLSGDNAGCSFNISTLSATPDNSATITVTISETAPTSSTDTALVRFDNWKTETAITDSTIGFKKVPFSAPAHGQFIQLKICLEGFDMQFDDLEPILKINTK